jgi:tRNA U54 and U55 pseudouridine synthase Pus10
VGGRAAQLAPHLRADRIKFMAAGREDMDVRMLGGGRPFVLEVLNARELPLSKERCEALQVGVSTLLPSGHVRVSVHYCPLGTCGSAIGS